MSMLRSLLEAGLENGVEQAPVFRSTLREALNNLMDESLTPNEWKARIIEPERVVRSSVRDPQTNRPIEGQFIERTIPQSIKLPGVKQEELEWSGLMDALDKSEHYLPGQKLSKADLLSHAKPPEVFEVMKTDNPDLQSDLEWGEPRMLDDPDEWEHMIEGERYYYRTERADELMDEAREWIKQHEADYISRNKPEDADLDEWIDENFSDEMGRYIDAEIDDRAENSAREMYFQNPRYETSAHLPNSDILDIRGDDDSGYSILVNGRYIDNAPDLEEAKIRAYTYARDKGMIADGGATEFGDYTLDGGDNYRELLLALPEGQKGGDFTRSHWDTPNVLAHLRMKKRIVEVPVPAGDLARYQDELTKYEAEHKRISDLRAALIRELEPLEAERVPLNKRYQEYVKEHHAQRMAKIENDYKAGKLTPAEYSKALASYEAPPETDWSRRLDANNAEMRAIRERAPALPEKPKAPGPGKKSILALEELQSDWHQKGRDNGYRDKNYPTADEAQSYERAARYAEQERAVEHGRAIDFLRGLSPNHSVESTDMESVLSRLKTEGEYDPRAVALYEKLFEKHEQAKSAALKYSEIQTQRHSAVPDGPYKNNAWADLALKRALRLAVDEGYDELAWLPGRVHADRYNMARHVDEISYNPETGALRAYPSGGGTHNAINETVPPEKLSDYVGSAIAERLLKGNKDEDGIVTVGGLDLELGGEGMKAFYDKVMPNRANAILKKLGAKVGVTKLPSSNFGRETRIIDVGNRSYTPDELVRVMGYGDFDASALPPSLRGAWERYQAVERGVAQDIESLRNEAGDGVQIKTDPRYNRALSRESAAKRELTEAISAEARDASLSIHSIKITPEIREAARKGFPLFGYAAMLGVPVAALRQAIEDEQRAAA